MCERNPKDAPSGSEQSAQTTRTASEGVSIDHFTVGDREYAVIEVPAGRRKELFARLTTAEAEVAGYMIRGKGNSEIASLRQTTERTVINQVSSIFEKLGVGSRAELARAIHVKTASSSDEEA